MKLALLWPDTHAPYHNVRAVELVLKVIADLDLHELIIMGDFADCYAVSAHGKHARMQHQLLDEIDKCNELLDRVDLSTKAKKVYLMGNHEHRLERFIFDKCPELFGVTEIENLLKLEKRGYRTLGYTPRQNYAVLGSKLRVRHEPLGSSAKASASRALASLAFGHTHRIEESYVVGLDGKAHVNFSVGWLGDERKTEVFGYCKHNQWQLGFGLVWVDPKTGFFHHQIVPILPNYTCVVMGKKYKA